MPQLPRFTVKLCILLLALAAPLSAQEAPRGGRPCERIVDACKGARFAEGDYRNNRINPIMRGTPQPPLAKIPLPQVDPQVIAACKQQNPNFGQPKTPRQGQSN